MADTDEGPEENSAEPPEDAVEALDRLQNLIALYPTDISVLSDRWDMDEEEVQRYLESEIGEDLSELVDTYTEYLLDTDSEGSTGRDQLTRPSTSEISELDTPYAEGDYLEIEVVGYGSSGVKIESSYATLTGEDEGDRKCTIICLYITNNTSTTWEFRSGDTSTTSTDGFSHDDALFLRSDTDTKISPWESGAMHDIPPNSKSRVILVYPEEFDPEKIEYDKKLLHTDLNKRSGYERITVEISESQREEINSLPKSLPIVS